jgi:tRNA(Ile)-lysidine synthase
LLDTGRQALAEYASREGLEWVEDPTNADRRFDRNFLRHDILPRLGARWPDISARLQRSASHAGEASQLLTSLAAIDLDFVGGRADKLAIDRLLQLSPARQRNVLRHALRQLGLATPTAMQLARIQNEVIPARADAQPLVTWSGAAVRRYRNSLYVLPETLPALPACIDVPAPGQAGAEVALGPGLGVLRFLAGSSPGLSEDVIKRGVQVRCRQGGEEFRPLGQRHTRKLKKLLQEEGVVPWMRERLPLVFSGDDLVAVGDLWLAEQAVAEPGVGLRWQDRPALH